jgi:hypothetical protein
VVSRARDRLAARLAEVEQRLAQRAGA